MSVQQDHNQKYSLGIVGGRGYVGQKLLDLVNQHPQISIEWISSRQLAGQPIQTLIETDATLAIENLTPEDIAERKTDVVVLALPNGLSQKFVNKLLAVKHAPKVIIDLSGDNRFDSKWHYSVSEIHGELINTVKFNKKNNSTILISNPGCYATAIQLALHPIKSWIKGSPSCFGISGFSGAGTKPSLNNDPAHLKDNIVPYQLIRHLHEREVSTHLDLPVKFTPHVAEFFAGISMTIHCQLTMHLSEDNLMALYQQFYQKHPLIQISKEIPLIQQVVNSHNCHIGGFAVNGNHLVLVSCLDNLLKGAASQALQNINHALNLDQTLGLLQDKTGV
ncbi:MAG: N-acetyl-gamma-glutamyl-phosphate reductase [Gammaproteobacteria bacterium]|nr:N-acetyl-gamma-glutamyl-phosphate reductase [Gammaproteobacteria bacterium]